jgi:hypothetical protein
MLDYCMAPPVLRWIYGESRPCVSIRPLDPIPREVVRRARIRVAAGKARKMQFRQIADLLEGRGLTEDPGLSLAHRLQWLL